MSGGSEAALLDATGIVVERGGRRVLDGVNLAVTGGEFVALVGPNGAGKSTLLRVLAGEVAPDAGQVRFEQRALARWAPRELARRRAVMMQHSSLDFPFSALEVVLLGRAPHLQGEESAADLEIARAALAAVGCLALAERLYPRLSGGERQRVQAARSLAQLGGAGAPRIWLLDEPTASLDLAHQHQLLALARRLVDGGTLGVVCVLHDLNLAARYATRVAVLAAQRVQADAPPREALTPAQLRPVFGVELLSLEHPSLSHPILHAAPPPLPGDP